MTDFLVFKSKSLQLTTVANAFKKFPNNSKPRQESSHPAIVQPNFYSE